MLKPGVARVLLVIALATTCGETGPAATTPATGSVTTDRAEYRLRNGMVDVVVRYRNDSDSARYLGLCGHDANVIIEQLEGRTWAPFQLWWCPLVLGPAIAVAPGDSHATRVRLGPAPSVDAPKPSGTLRVRLEAYTQIDEHGYATGTPVLGALTTSPAFTVRE